MLILTNCLSEIADEGCLNVVNSLVKRMKAVDKDITVISYERQSGLSDAFLHLNKFLLNKKLYFFIRRRKEPVLFMPFPAKPFSIAVRVFVLSLYCKKRLRVLLPMNEPMGLYAKLLIRLSNAEFVVLSEESQRLFLPVVGKGRIHYLKTGVDIKKFQPTTAEQATSLKAKYGFDPARPVVLHVGHLNRGRNIGTLCQIDPKYQVLLVTSTLTKDEQDEALRQELLSHSNIRILSDYIPAIQELYQLADAYFFPVTENGHCIDVPLSCLEAAACGKNVVTTRYGEMKAFEGRPGFFYLSTLDYDNINQTLDLAIKEPKGSAREEVMAYDWNRAIQYLLYT